MKLPHAKNLDTPAKIGEIIVVCGTVLKKDRFTINLCSGPVTTGPTRDDVVMQVDVRLTPNTMVFNTFRSGKWDAEQRILKNEQFVKGKPFKVDIKVAPDAFQVSANNSIVVTYAHRIRPPLIRTVHVEGSVQLDSIHVDSSDDFEWVEPKRIQEISNSPFSNGTENHHFMLPNVPFYHSFPTKLREGNRIYVSGKPKQCAEGFKINLHASDDIAFQFNPRFDEETIVCNVKQNNKWENSEARSESFPFRRDTSFDLVIRCLPTEFRITQGHVEMLSFAHRLPLPLVDRIAIEGDVNLYHVEFQ